MLNCSSSQTVLLMRNLDVAVQKKIFKKSDKFCRTDEWDNYSTRRQYRIMFWYRNTFTRKAKLFSSMLDSLD